jgi:hypothetical protein
MMESSDRKVPNSKETAAPPFDRFYFYLFEEEEDARVCKDIPEKACTEVPRNFFRIGAAVLGLVILFSLARGLCSVASKDVIGKTVPKTRRGRLTGFSAAVSGTLTFFVGLALVTWVGGEASFSLFAALLVAAAGLWLAASGLFAGINEEPGATGGGGNALHEALKRLDILRTDPEFRRFVVVRALLISTALAGPYYVMLARESGGGGEMLGLFVLASGLASSLSSAFWGRYADRSSRSVLMASAGMAACLGTLLFVLDLSGLLNAGLYWVVPLAFFVLSIAHTGVRVGRKTYILDLAGGERRTDYVAVSNTLIGLLLLATGLLGGLTPVIGPSGMLLLLAMMSAAGIVLAFGLPEAE